MVKFDVSSTPRNGNPQKDNIPKQITLCLHLKVHTVGLNHHHTEINIILITIALKHFRKQIAPDSPVTPKSA